MLYPAIDQSIWRPTNVAEWQSVVFELARRYSVLRKLVTHWEIGNETDIGEEGGTPYLIPDPAAYTEFYRMTIQPILKAFPGAKVGGPATTWAAGEPLPGFVARCRDQGIPLHFVSWHRYDDDPAVHSTGVRQVKQRLAGWPGKQPELMVTEWSKSFDPVSLEEMAFDPARAATIASCILAMMDAGLDWSFYYHLWDQICHPGDFAPFFSPKGVTNMAHHWNETPHRFGLFGVNREVRPQYFVYQVLGRLGEGRIAAESDDSAVQVLAAKTQGRVAALCIHRGQKSKADRIINLRFSGLRVGLKRLVVYRLDAARRWNPATLEMLPVERREVDTGAEFSCQMLAPADSVTMVRLGWGASSTLTPAQGPGIIHKLY